MKECSESCTLFCYVCPMEIAVITYHSPEYDEMLALRYEILREPWGLCFSEEDLQQEKDDIFIVCREKGCIIGCCILTGQTLSTVIKLRQMAVSCQWQGKNVGKNILEFAEQYAAGLGYATIRLHARKTASMFYVKCGYIVSGAEFLEIGMPHILMEKVIC